jgi:hypothetical protein
MELLGGGYVPRGCVRAQCCMTISDHFCQRQFIKTLDRVAAHTCDGLADDGEIAWPPIPTPTPPCAGTFSRCPPTSRARPTHDKISKLRERMSDGVGYRTTPTEFSSNTNKASWDGTAHTNTSKPLNLQPRRLTCTEATP